MTRFAAAIASLLFPNRSKSASRRRVDPHRKLRFERLEQRNLLTTNVNLFISQETALENGTAPALFGIERSGDGLDQALTVEYSLGGTATLGSDYHTGSGSVTFAPYQTSLTLSVSPVDDDALEGPETVVVTLAPSEQYTSQTDSVTLTILDDEVNHAPSFTAGNSLVVRDDAGPQTFTGWATDITTGPANEANQSLTFLVETDNAALFSAQPTNSADGTLSFTPNAGAFGVATVTVRLQDDGGTESSGTGESGYDTSEPQTFTISVGPTLSINGVSVSEAGGTATFIVTLSHAVCEPVTVDWQAQNGSAATSVDFSPQVWIDGYEAGHWQPGYDVNPYTVSDGCYQPGYDVNAYDVLVGYWQSGYEVNNYYDEFNNFMPGFWSPGEYVDPAWTGGYTYSEHWIDEGSYNVPAFWSEGETVDPAWINGYTYSEH